MKRMNLFFLLVLVGFSFSCGSKKPFQKYLSPSTAIELKAGNNNIIPLKKFGEKKSLNLKVKLPSNWQKSDKRASLVFLDEPQVETNLSKNKDLVLISFKASKKDQLDSALGYLKTNANHFGLDPKRIKLDY